jgi:hypothetical protein
METIGDLCVDSPHSGLGDPRHLRPTLTMISERAQRELRALVVLVAIAVVILTGVLLIW